MSYMLKETQRFRPSRFPFGPVRLMGKPQGAHKGAFSFTPLQFDRRKPSTWLHVGFAETREPQSLGEEHPQTTSYQSYPSYVCDADCGNPMVVGQKLGIGVPFLGCRGRDSCQQVLTMFSHLGVPTVATVVPFWGLRSKPYLFSHMAASHHEPPTIPRRSKGPCSGRPTGKMHSFFPLAAAFTTTSEAAAAASMWHVKGNAFRATGPRFTSSAV